MRERGEHGVIIPGDAVIRAFNGTIRAGQDF